MQPQLFLHLTDGGEGLLGLGLLSGYGERQAVNEDILLGDAVGQSGIQNPPGNLHALFCALGDALLVHGKADNGGAVLLDDGEDGVQHFLFAVDRVDDGLTMVVTQSRLNGPGVRGVDL